MLLRPAETAIDVSAIAIWIGAMAQIVPNIAAVLSVIWLSLRIYESETLKNWRKEREKLRAMQKIEITLKVAMEIAGHEAVIRQAYKDSVGVWTWSVGLTDATGHNVTRYIDKPQPMEHCLGVFVWALRKYAKEVLEAFDGYKLTEAQFAAALSFHWNTGSIKQASWVKSVKKGDLSTARRQIMNWNKPKAVISRRSKERDLFFEGKWSGNGKMTEYTRLTSKHTPQWSSGKQVDVTVALIKALAFTKEPEPQPVPVVVVEPAPVVVTVPPAAEPPVAPVAAEPAVEYKTVWQRIKAWLFV